MGLGGSTISDEQNRIIEEQHFKSVKAIPRRKKGGEKVVRAFVLDTFNGQNLVVRYIQDCLNWKK